MAINVSSLECSSFNSEILISSFSIYPWKEKLAFSSCRVSFEDGF
jgi:hypothetical protein